MNTAETKIMNNAAYSAGYLAPITRIGGGEVRVDRAFKSPAAAWADGNGRGPLSFGFVDAWPADDGLSKIVTVRNYSGTALTYAIKPTFRYSNDRLQRRGRVLRAVDHHHPGAQLAELHASR